ncbi:MAG: PspC domain-containing protein [Candidatus Methanosuratus sp.]|nr:PspC domain-containing protein [Candidatus Methanosuratincola sp.]
MSSAPKRLYRSNSDRILGGVCGGIAAYFGIDPIIIRLLWVAFTLVYGFGLLVYIIAWIIVPRAPEGYTGAQSSSQLALSNKSTRNLLILTGSILIVMGVLGYFGILKGIALIFRTVFSFPFILIVVGVLVILVAILSRR